MLDAAFLLKPSPIKGIGVFANRDFIKGEILELFDPKEPTVRCRGEDMTHEVWQYSIQVTEDLYVCPTDLRRLSIGWYMNHSSDPNARAVHCAEDLYVAIRPIAKGEEVVVNYLDLSSFQRVPDSWI